MKKICPIITLFIFYSSLTAQTPSNNYYDVDYLVDKGYKKPSEKIDLRICFDMDFAFSKKTFGAGLGYSLQFKPKWNIGLGAIIENNKFSLPLNNYNDTISMISVPFYLSGKYFPISFLNHSIQPYFKTLIGYNIAVEDENSGRLIFINGLGIQFAILHKVFFRIGISQLNQKIISNLDQDDGSKINYNFWHNDIVWDIGISINMIPTNRY